MREILFRGKRLDNGEWVEGYFVEFLARYHRSDKMGAYIQTIKEDGKLDLIHEIDPTTVGQYTGLKDKNGKRIFEGDIVQSSYYFDQNKRAGCDVVQYGEFNCECCNGVYGWHFGDEDIRENERYIVVGNIHDNPELLGGNNG